MASDNIYGYIPAVGPDGYVSHGKTKRNNIVALHPALLISGSFVITTCQLARINLNNFPERGAHQQIAIEGY